MEQSIVRPLLTELERISGRVDTERALADQALIGDLRREIAELRAAVAHLRAGATPLPGRLRPVVARAMTTVGCPVAGHKT
jgi:type II secretory pathway component PulM